MPNIYRIIVAKCQMRNATDIARKVPMATCMNKGCVSVHRQKDCHISVPLIESRMGTIKCSGCSKQYIFSLDIAGRFTRPMVYVNLDTKIG